jgi:peptide/nickel transport system permease protein
LDFGVSHLYKDDVLSLVLKKLRYSICLSVATLLIIYLVSVPLGIWSAANANSPADRVVTVVLFILYSLPSFWVATILLNFLTKGTPFEILPTGGFSSIDAGDLTTIDYIKDVMWHITLPVLCMTYGGLAALSRYARTGLLDVIRSDYVRTARAKGLSEGVVIVKHAARNGMIPIITLLATLLPALIGGSVVIEFIFQIPGIGSFMFESIQARDYNVVMCILLITSLLTLVGMLLADLLYALVDPRITFD